MQIEDIIIQKLLNKNKTKKVILFKPTEPEDNRKKLTVLRPTENSILPSEVYEDTKNPANEKQVIQAIKNLEAQGKVKSIQTQRSNEIFYWVELK
jgi:hypothetical protein